MNDEAFLQAILANPDDDHLRLIYADWLEERGDPRGEFIRVQIELAAADVEGEGTRLKELKIREQELLLEHGTQWLRPVADVVLHAEFGGGLVEQVLLTAKSFVAHAETLFRRAPISHMK